MKNENEKSSQYLKNDDRKKETFNGRNYPYDKSYQRLIESKLLDNSLLNLLPLKGEILPGEPLTIAESEVISNLTKHTTSC